MDDDDDDGLGCRGLSRLHSKGGFSGSVTGDYGSFPCFVCLSVCRSGCRSRNSSNNDGQGADGVGPWIFSLLSLGLHGLAL